jgi:hypothetical protein
MCEVDPEADASIRAPQSQPSARTVALAISASMCRRALRIVCMRIHDVEGVRTVEVDCSHASIRVTGTMDVGDLVAALRAAESDLLRSRG